jgi:hypothetical protein
LVMSETPLGINPEQQLRDILELTPSPSSPGLARLAPRPKSQNHPGCSDHKFAVFPGDPAVQPDRQPRIDS